MKVLKGNEKKEYDEFISHHVESNKVYDVGYKSCMALSFAKFHYEKPPKDFEPLWKKASVIL